MSDRLQARLRCREVTTREGPTETVVLRAVYSDDPDHPNKAFTDATPHAEFEMQIENEEAQGFFEPGREYDVTLAPVEGDG